MTTHVVNIRNLPYNWTKDPSYVYCGREGKGFAGTWGNPIEKGKVCPVCDNIHKSPGDTLPCFKKVFDESMHIVDYRNDLHQLKDHTLVCFCRPPEGFQGRLLCHCQIYAGYLDKIPPEQVK